MLKVCGNYHSVISSRLALKIVVMTKEQGGGSNPHWDGLGRVEDGYYPAPLSVKSGRATFTAPSFRCS
ncbi:MAG: hypothetical protein AN486_23770 [Anabaena sp. AL93]|nr:MAG: hypothetical protein AN486_23770 [Anabaena sp. AL93]